MELILSNRTPTQCLNPSYRVSFIFFFLSIEVTLFLGKNRKEEEVKAVSLTLALP